MSRSNRLPTLAAEIVSAHTEALRCASMSVEHAIRAGDALMEAKALVPHGGWLPWLYENCQMSERTCQRYMRLARHKDKLDPTHVADFTLTGALGHLRARSEHERLLALEAGQAALRKEIQRLAESIDHADAEELGEIVSRLEDIIALSVEGRMIGTRELGRLLIAGHTIPEDTEIDDALADRSRQLAACSESDFQREVEAERAHLEAESAQLFCGAAS